MLRFRVDYPYVTSEDIQHAQRFVQEQDEGHFAGSEPIPMTVEDAAERTKAADSALARLGLGAGTWDDVKPKRKGRSLDDL